MGMSGERPTVHAVEALTRLRYSSPQTDHNVSVFAIKISYLRDKFL